MTIQNVVTIVGRILWLKSNLKIDSRHHLLLGTFALYCLKCEVEVASLGVHSPAAGAHPPLKRCFQEPSNAFPVSLLSTPCACSCNVRTGFWISHLASLPRHFHLFSSLSIFYVSAQTYTCINLMNISLNLGKEPTLKAVNTLEVLTLPHPEISPL